MERANSSAYGLECIWEGIVTTEQGLYVDETWGQGFVGRSRHEAVQQMGEFSQSTRPAGRRIHGSEPGIVTYVSFTESFQ
jgi:hypothetical protein